MPRAAKHHIWLLLLGVLVLAGCAKSWPLRSFAETAVAPILASQQERGREHLAAGRFGLAIAEFRDAVKANPNSVEALNGLAAAYDHIGRYDVAALHYERALALDPNSAQTLNNIGFSQMLQGKFDLATVFFRDAQQRDQGDPAIATNRTIAEAALRATRPRPGTQWLAPTDKDDSPLPRAWVERTTPLVQTLVAQPRLMFVNAGVDTLPDMLAAPIGDTRLSATYDRLPRPMAASMADARIAKTKRRRR